VTVTHTVFVQVTLGVTVVLIVEDVFVVHGAVEHISVALGLRATYCSKLTTLLEESDPGSYLS
jgi:hypothetical protein